MIEYIDETHTYLIDGIIVPSVTQILEKVFPNKYIGVPEKVLREKADYGTHVHWLIQIIEERKPKKPLAYLKRYCGMNFIEEESIKQYLELKKKNKIEIMEIEKLVHYENKYCGRLDIKALVNGKRAIIDIKTTATFDEEYVSWQTSYYELADEPQENLYCLWLPKRHLGNLIKLKRKTKKELLKVLEEI